VECAGSERASGVHGFAARRGIVPATGSHPRTLPELEPYGRRVVTSDDER
jgi:dihydrolipoamide dehydrogenase